MLSAHCIVFKTFAAAGIKWYSHLAQQPAAFRHWSSRDREWPASEFFSKSWRPVAVLSDGAVQQVASVIQGSPASQLFGVGESGQRAPLIENGDIIVKVIQLDLLFLQQCVL